MAIELSNCNLCGGEVFVWISAGGANNESRTFAVTCSKCKNTVDNLGVGRAKRDAIREWNRYVKKAKG